MLTYTGSMYVWSVDPRLILLPNQSALTLTKVTFWPIGTSNCDISLQSFIFTCRSLLLTVTSFRIEFGPSLTGDTLLLLLHKLTPLCHFSNSALSASETVLGRRNSLSMCTSYGNEFAGQHFDSLVSSMKRRDFADFYVHDVTLTNLSASIFFICLGTDR